MENRINSIVNYLKTSFEKYKPKISVVLGSGLGYLVDELQDKKIISTEDIPDYPISTVEGHSGNWVFGYYYDKPVLFLQGRVHRYEGYHIKEVVMSIKAMAISGIETMLVTNSAGGLNPNFKPGDLMIIEDQINLMFQNPLIGKTLIDDERFIDMSKPFCSEYIKKLEIISNESKIEIKKGVFVGMTGPNFETPAEVRFLQQIGGDAVSMSTVPEVIEAIKNKIKVAGISCISNLASGLSKNKLSHKEVTETANKIKYTFGRLVGQFILSV